MFLWVALLVVVCVVGVFGFGGYGGQSLGGGLRRDDRVAVVRGLAALAAALALGAYGWGLLGVGGAVLEAEDGGTGSAPLRPCRAEGWEREAAAVVGYRVRWVPLEVVCETSDGGSYGSGDVPAYVNPLVFVFGVAAAGGALSCAYVGELRARQRRRAGYAAGVSSGTPNRRA